MSLREQLIVGDELETTDSEVRITLALPRYRSLPLSCVEPRQVRIDGVEIDGAGITLHVNGKTRTLDQLRGLHDEWWFVADRAELRVAKPGGIPAGRHEVEVVVALRLPYGVSEAGVGEVRREVVSCRKRLWCVPDHRREVSPEGEAGLRFGVSLYSFTPEFHGHRYDLERLIAKVAESRLGPGLEIVGFQSLRGFPEVSEALAGWFRDLLERHGLRASCLDANVDVGIRSDRLLTETELVDYLRRQVEAARKLGFPVVRLQYDASPDVIERLLPVAERAGVKLGVEIHAPHSVHHPTIARLRERYEQLQSPYLGFIPDLGACTVRVPRILIDAYQQRGVPGVIIDTILDAWQEARARGEDPFRASSRLRARVEAMNGGPDALTMAWHVFLYCGYQRPEAWIEIMPQIVHVHAKFFEIDDDGNEPNVPYRDLVAMFRDHGYAGGFSSEYEGWQWDEGSGCERNGFALVRAHQRLCRSVARSAHPRSEAR
ncbi:MAG TPA: DUF6379 domain-containing protein [Candidatus Dormibacteraeota bacterium]|nr:DUF6379 domain-containing protein [Candidatus Dormibacteraeota bacterium]